MRCVEADLLEWTPDRAYDLWHDRAVFHFLVGDADRERYALTLHASLRAGGHAIVGSFAADGPPMCSGLPVHRHTVEDLAGSMPGFDLLVARREKHITPRGVTQPFTWVAGRVA